MFWIFLNVTEICKSTILVKYFNVGKKYSEYLNILLKNVFGIPTIKNTLNDLNSKIGIFYKTAN